MKSCITFRIAPGIYIKIVNDGNYYRNVWMIFGQNFLIVNKCSYAKLLLFYSKKKKSSCLSAKNIIFNNLRLYDF